MFIQQECAVFKMFHFRKINIWMDFQNTEQFQHTEVDAGIDWKWYWLVYKTVGCRQSWTWYHAHTHTHTPANLFWSTIVETVREKCFFFQQKFVNLALCSEKENWPRHFPPRRRSLTATSRPRPTAGRRWHRSTANTANMHVPPDCSS